MIIVVEVVSSREQDIEGTEMRLDGLRKQGVMNKKHCSSFPQKQRRGRSLGKRAIF